MKVKANFIVIDYSYFDQNGEPARKTEFFGRPNKVTKAMARNLLGADKHVNSLEEVVKTYDIPEDVLAQYEINNE